MDAREKMSLQVFTPVPLVLLLVIHPRRYPGVLFAIIRVSRSALSNILI